MDRKQDVSAFILAGGKSTRMGKDKALVALHGRTLLERALELACSVTSDVRIVGSREKFAAFAPVVEDVFRNCGPLGGIHAALQASASDLNVMLAVDTPFLTPSFLHYLIDRARETSDAEITVPHTTDGWQPLCAVYRREFMIEAEKALRAGKYKIDPLFSVVRTRVIEQEELESAGFRDDLFRNLNTPEDLQAEARRA